MQKLWLDLETGLSPLSRGTLISNITDHAIQRFIPALAGNTKSLYSHFD